MTMQLWNQTQQFQRTTRHLRAIETDGMVDPVPDPQLRTKQLLDRLFPLNQASHVEVSHYLIDMQHLVAFTRDGRHSGLKYPKHFVGFIGTREAPTSILLSQANGCHVEIMIGRRSGNGSLQDVLLDDVQMETCSFLMEPEEMQSMTHCLRHWVSLLHHTEHRKPYVAREDKEFNAKDGSEFILYANDMYLD